MTNQLLDQTKKSILTKADPRLVPTIQKTVAAGVKILNAPQTQQMVKQQLGAGNDPETIGAGIAKIAGMLFNESKKQLPPQILMPASAILLCDGLGALEEAGTTKVDANFLAACTKAMGSNLAQLFGVTPDKLQGVVNQAPQQPTPAPQPAQPAGIIAGAQGAPA